MIEFYRDNKKAIDKFVYIALTLLAAYLFARFLVAYFAPFIIGYIISLIIGKPVDFMHSKLKIWRGVCVLFMLLLCVSAILAGGALIIGQLLREIESFAHRLPEYMEVITTAIDRVQYALEGFIGDSPYFFGIPLDDIITDFGTQAASSLASFVTRNTLNAAAGLPRLILVIIFSVISAFFFTKDKKAINTVLATTLPAGMVRSLRNFKRGMSAAAGGYIKAQLILMSLVTAISFLGLAIMGNPYAIFIGLAIGALDILPILGAGSVLVPWAIVSFMMGNVQLGISLLILYGVCMLSRQSLEPKIVGEQIGVHPLLTLMAIFIGLTMFGPMGIILGPFIAIAIKVAFSDDIHESKPIIKEE